MVSFVRSCRKPLLLLGVLTLAACAGQTSERPQTRQSRPNQPIQSGPAPKLSLPDTTPAAALYLPLSGENAGLGQQLLNAAQMALFDSSETNLRLFPIDTADPSRPISELPSGTTVGVNIGPVFSQDVRLWGGRPEFSQAPTLALTNDRSVARPGLYVMGITPEDQISRVLDYAYSQGVKRFAALLPQNTFGEIARAELDKKARENPDIQITHPLFYQPNNSDPSLLVQQLVDQYQLSTFDALLLPEGGARGKRLATLVRNAGLIHVRLLGSSLWNDVATDPVFGGGWFASTPQERWQIFSGKFRQAFDEEPDRRAALAYDTVALLASLNQRNPNRAELENSNGYMGITGLFRLNERGIVERRLPVLEANPTGVVTRDPARTLFSSATN